METENTKKPPFKDDNKSSLKSRQPESLNILVVEDSRSARMKIVSSLVTLDVNIFEADDGRSALEILVGEKQKIDLVLTDLNMKTMDGDELCSKIRNELKLFDLPVIVLSSRIDKKTTLNLFAIGATDFLYKPFTAEELVARINTHLERLRLNKILIKQIDELTELNHIKDDLLAVCSHDFRSPLQIIMGYTDLMIGDNSMTSNNKKMLTSMQKSSEALLEMIDQILVLGKAEKLSGKVGILPQSVKKIVRECVTNFHRIASNKKIKLSFTDIDANPMVNGNQNELTRIFNNLLSNAIKFTPTGGTVSVRFEIDENKILAISITDNGIGIAENEMPELFKKYSSISKKGTGGEQNTGLGLFITRELIEKYQGSIDVQSDLTKGSCFTVRLPIVDKSHANVIQELIEIEKGQK